jgi:hypothetical protein
MEYIGIADAHGLESFIPAREYNAEEERFTTNNKAIGFMSMRANANRHRHAVVYKADLSRENADVVYEMMEKGEYSEALSHLKANANEVGLIKSPGAEKSWNLIPNPDLDPFS